MANPPASELKREQSDPRHERSPPAEQVAGAGAEEEEAAEGQDVGVEHPRERRAGEMEAALDVGQGDVHDGGVEHHHQLGGEDDAEDHRRVAAPPAGAPAGRGLTGPLTSAFPLVFWEGSGSFLRLVYGGCLRFASDFLRVREVPGP